MIRLAWSGWQPCSGIVAAIHIIAHRPLAVMAGPDPAIPAAAVPAVICQFQWPVPLGMAGTGPAMTMSAIRPRRD